MLTVLRLLARVANRKLEPVDKQCYEIPAVLDGYRRNTRDEISMRCSAVRAVCHWSDSEDDVINQNVVHMDLHVHDQTSESLMAARCSLAVTSEGIIR